MSGASVFIAASQGMPLDHQALVASRVCVHEFDGIIAEEKKILNYLSLQVSVHRQ